METYTINKRNEQIPCLVSRESSAAEAVRPRKSLGRDEVRAVRKNRILQALVGHCQGLGFYPGGDKKPLVATLRA